MSDTLPSNEEPVIFKLFTDFLTAEKILKSFTETQPSPEFASKVRASYNKICTELDRELNLHADMAPPIPFK